MRNHAYRWVLVLLGCSANLLDSTYAEAQPLPPFNQPDFPPGATIEFKATETAVYDSNPLLRAQGARSIYGSETVPEVIIRSSTPRSQFMLDASAAEKLYNDSDFNSTDLHGNGFIGTKNERWNANLGAKADYDTVRSSEITTFGLNLADVRHTGFNVTPQLSFTPEPTDVYAVTGLAISSAYDNPAFVDYHIYGLNPSYYHRFDPNNYGNITLNVQRYETTEGSDYTSDTIGPSFGWTTLLSERFTAAFSAGFQNNTQDNAATSSKSKNFTYTFYGNLAYKGEQDIANATASRAQQPFGTAREALLTSFSVNERHFLNENVSLRAASSYQFAQYTSQPGINLDNLFRLNAGLSYQIVRYVDANATYQYTSEKLTGVSGAINASTVMIGLTYHPVAGTL